MWLINRRKARNSLERTNIANGIYNLFDYIYKANGPYNDPKYFGSRHRGERSEGDSKLDKRRAGLSPA